MTPEEMRKEADRHLRRAEDWMTSVATRRVEEGSEYVSAAAASATAHATIARALIARAQDVDALRPTMTIITPDDCKKMGWPKDWVGQQIELKFVEGVRR